MLNQKVMVAVLAGVQPNAYPIIIPERLGDETTEIKFNKTTYAFRIDRRDIRNWFGVPTVLLDFKTMCSLPQETLEKDGTVISPQDLDSYWVSLQNLGISLEAEKRKPDFFKENLPLLAAILAGGALVVAFLNLQAISGVGNTVSSLHSQLAPLLNANVSAGVVIKPI